MKPPKKTNSQPDW